MVTIKDIARATKLSPSTISRVLNNHPAVNPKTRQMVQECIAQLHYSPNRNAQNLVKQSNRTIGFMIPDIADSFFSMAAIGVEEVLYANGLEVAYRNTNREPKRVRDYLNRAQEYRYSGVFMTPDTWDSSLVDMVHKVGMPVVSLRRKTPFANPQIPYVDSDHYTGFREASEYLLSLGHRDIGLITADTLIYNERQRGYEETVRYNHLKPHVLCHKNPIPAAQRYRCGYESARALLEESSEITAIMATEDRFAIGAMEYLHEKGLRVPEDVSVIGCDNRPEGQLYPIQLSTVQQDILELGRQAARMMVRLIDDPGYQPVSISLKPRLVIRKTTAQNAKG